MKQIPFLILITLGMVACGLSSPPKPVPVVEVTPAPVIEAAPIQEVAKVTSPGCHCNVCNCTVCKCETVTDGPTPLTEEEFADLQKKLKETSTIGCVHPTWCRSVGLGDSTQVQCSGG